MVFGIIIATAFSFIGVPECPQEARQEETPVVQPVAEETAVAYPILIGIP